ncbi:DUF1553 domain-containing protein [uncultured Gimesia sp.]|uniref:DUF1553 domain-containing protein n=1 Tax=uncultured Gimesia sp. TaxID=1678688 RepID=UPI0030DAEDEF|tara:strand:+ start:41289 stop:44189 length:2901 start_codon:yes stop_codon:yes gene_type:complete
MRSLITRVGLTCLLLASLGLLVPASETTAESKTNVDFEKQIAPLIVEHCIRCHNPGNEKGELSLTSIQALKEKSFLTPGKPDESYLLEVIHVDPKTGKAEMPKGAKPLSQDEVALFTRWIQQGATWPAELKLQEKSKADLSWWSLQPLAESKPPTAKGLPEAWQKQPIDRFIAAKLQEKKLQPSPRASKRTLIRRATYNLIGLPPTPEEVATFENDSSPDAYEKLIDRLLASPRYGEQWGRHWLDVVRFGESNGFERNVIIDNAWPFRDYVIQSFNDDKPFDQMVIEHLAGDVVGKGDPNVEVGTTFLVCGPYDNVGNQDPVQKAQIRANTIDDMIRTTGEAFLGLTVGCSRCHNHKFDPVLQKDYYSLYATFSGVFHGSRVIASPEAQQNRNAQLKPLAAQKTELQKEKTNIESAIQARAEKKAAEYEKSWVRDPASRTGIEDTFEPVSAKFVRLTSQGLDTSPWAKTGYRVDEFEVWTTGETPRNIALATNGSTAKGANSRTAGDFAGAYDVSLTIDGKIGACWIAGSPDLTIELAQPETINKIVFSSDRSGAAMSNYKATFLAEYKLEVSPDGKTWKEVASSKDRKPVNAKHRRKRFFILEATPDENKRLSQINAEIAKTGRELAAIPSLPSWWVGNHKQVNGPFHIFVGGNPQRNGDKVVPASMSTLSNVTKGYQLEATAPQGERRLALARWMVAKENPLTPRVLANRLWHYHFGTGIVSTPSDFGYMGTRPTHPKLLDWLAVQIQENGWRLKDIQKQIMMSETYQQASTFREDAARIDSGSRYLWRFPPRRLSGEEIRDTLLSVSGKLDLKMGGPGFRLYEYLQDNVATYVPRETFGPETYRRAVYHQNARAARIDLLTDFDCPDNAFAASKRNATTTPLQALTLMNHQFTLDLSQFLAERVQHEAGTDNVDQQIARAFHLLYTRPPVAQEQQAARTLIAANGLPAFCRALINSNELIYLD